jgi:hypothetical protein
VVKEENMYKSQPLSRSALKAEVEKIATDSWNTPVVRARVEEAEAKHFSGMYSRIFSGRRR